jgi:ABC-2 type transport system ATP-binding protein
MTTPPAPALEVAGLSRWFEELRAVDGVTFSVAPGEVLGLLGPNGAGKTTTLRCLAGIARPTAGRIRIAGHDLSTAPVEAKRALAYLPDEPRLFEYLTVKEHLNLVARLWQVEGWEATGQALLEELDLAGKDAALPGELSRGMKQKLSIACGLLHAPRVIVLDEPLTGLDPLAIRKVKDTLRARAAGGTAILLSSHLLPLVEELCDRILVIAGGRMAAHGTIAEIRAAAGAHGSSLEDVFVKITTAPPEPAVAVPAQER